MTKRRIAAEPRKPWTAEDDAVLRARFPHELTATVAAALGRSVPATHGHAHFLGLAKSEAFRSSAASGRLLPGDHRGAATRFKPGQTSHNKGVKFGPGYAPGRMKEGQFTKNSAPYNWRPIGFERVIGGYLWRKVSDVRHVPWTRNWKQVHILVWEEANGPLPKGFMLAFKNKDRTDIRLDNLECVSRQEWMLRHTIHNLPPALKETVQLLGRVTRQIRKRERNGQEQDHRPS